MGEITSGERRIDSDALAERAARAASGLASLGVGRGDTVAVYLRNDLPFFEASYAAGRLGAYPTPVNWHYTEDEARYLFENSGARAIVIHADLIEPVRTALPPGVPVLVVETPPEVTTRSWPAAAACSARISASGSSGRMPRSVTTAPSRSSNSSTRARPP